MPRVEFIRSETVAREHRLPMPVAREIVIDETQRALRRSGVAWGLLLCGIAGAAWLATGSGAGGKPALALMLGSMVGWVALGRVLAGPAIRQTAMEKAARIAAAGR